MLLTLRDGTQIDIPDPEPVGTWKICPNESCRTYFTLEGSVTCPACDPDWYSAKNPNDPNLHSFSES